MPNTYTILIVDDSATTRAMIKRVILMAGLPIAEILEAGDGGQALNILASRTNAQAVDLVFTDLNMPGVDGVEMTRRMRENQATRNIPVVVITARPDDQELDGLKHGVVQGWLSKPFTPESVRDLLGRLLAPGGVYA